MFKGGRPVDIIYEHVNKTEKDRVIFAKCEKCDNIQSNIVCRLKSHYGNCLTESEPNIQGILSHLWYRLFFVFFRVFFQFCPFLIYLLGFDTARYVDIGFD